MPTESPQETWERMSLWDVIRPKGRKGVYPGRESAIGDVVGAMIQRAPAGSLANYMTDGKWPGKAPGRTREDVGYDVMDMITPGPLGIGQVDAFHGSPHSFNRFKNEAMGTGEGAQAFGWGHYFTDEKAVAESYAKQGKGVKFKVRREGKVINVDPQKRIAKVREKHGNEIADQLDELLDMIGSGETTLKQAKSDMFGMASSTNNPTWMEAHKLLRDADDIVQSNNLYKVQIHKGKDPSEYDYLDWDKVTDGPTLDKIREQAKKENIDLELLDDLNPMAEYNGQDIYRGLANTVGARELSPGKWINEKSDKEASMFLLRAGIDGIRYPTGSLSGVKNSKAKNYVVFDPEAVTIEERMSY